MTPVYEGTPEQIARQLSKLPKSHKYVVTITSEKPEVITKEQHYIKFGMFPQLQGLTEADFTSAEWHGEDIEA